MELAERQTEKGYPPDSIARIVGDIQAGFPPFVEKPLVLDLKEADTLLNEEAKRNLFFAINFANGAFGSLIGTYDSSYAYPDTHRVELDGTNGRAVIYDTVKRYTFNHSDSEIGESWEAGYFNDEDQTGPNPGIRVATSDRSNLRIRLRNLFRETSASLPATRDGP